MSTATITIPVDADVASAYAAATPQQRKKIELLLNLQLKDLTTRPRRPLEEVMDALSRQARENGLTPEILDKFLEEES